MAHHEEDHHYHPKDAISAATKAAALTGAVGLVGSAVQNTLARRNVGALGVLTRSGGTVGIFGKRSSVKCVDNWLNANMASLLAAMGGTYEFVKTASANLREADDCYNTALGGFFSGSLLGFRGEL